MTLTTILTLAALFYLAALLYSSVGHAGASGYLAAMALVGVEQNIMRPTSLALNIIVATIASIQFLRVRQFSWRLYWPFAFGAVPLAFFGGSLTLPSGWYYPLIGFILLITAIRLSLTESWIRDNLKDPPSIVIGIVTGAGIGLLSGITGTGGGIFLSPIILAMGWSNARVTSGISAMFILGNSIAGLLGILFAAQSAPLESQGVQTLPSMFPWWAVAVLLGGLTGSYLGLRKLTLGSFRRLLALVLFIAAGKLLMKF